MQLKKDLRLTDQSALHDPSVAQEYAYDTSYNSRLSTAIVVLAWFCQQHWAPPDEQIYLIQLWVSTASLSDAVPYADVYGPQRSIWHNKCCCKEEHSIKKAADEDLYIGSCVCCVSCHGKYLAEVHSCLVFTGSAPSTDQWSMFLFVVKWGCWWSLCLFQKYLPYYIIIIYAIIR